MTIESGPIVNIEQRRLAPVIENTLTEFVAKQAYVIDFGFYDGFSGDEPRITALKHSFLEPTSTKFSVTAINQDGSETMISADLAESIGDAVNKSLEEADVSYVVSPNSADTTVHTYFTLTRTT